MVTCITCPAGNKPKLPNGNYTDGLLGVFRSTPSGEAGSWTTQIRNNSAILQDTLLLSNPINGALTQAGVGTSQSPNKGWYEIYWQLIRLIADKVGPAALICSVQTTVASTGPSHRTGGSREMALRQTMAIPVRAR